MGLQAYGPTAQGLLDGRGSTNGGLTPDWAMMARCAWAGKGKEGMVVVVVVAGRWGGGGGGRRRKRVRTWRTILLGNRSGGVSRDPKAEEEEGADGGGEEEKRSQVKRSRLSTGKGHND